MNKPIVLVYIKDYGALNKDGNWYNDRYLHYVGIFHDIDKAHTKQMELRESMNREHDQLFLTSDLSYNYENGVDDSMCEFEIEGDLYKPMELI